MARGRQADHLAQLRRMTTTEQETYDVLDQHQHHRRSGSTDPCRTGQADPSQYLPRAPQGLRRVRQPLGKARLRAAPMGDRRAVPHVSHRRPEPSRTTQTPAPARLHRAPDSRSRPSPQSLSKPQAASGLTMSLFKRWRRREFPSPCLLQYIAHRPLDQAHRGPYRVFRVVQNRRASRQSCTIITMPESRCDGRASAARSELIT